MSNMIAITRVEYDAILQTNQNYQAENARLRAALEAVEWIEDRFEYRYCPWCSGSDNENDPNYGHAPDCQRQIALGLMPRVQGACDPDWNEIKAAEEQK